MLLWKQAISYKPGLPSSFIDEETLILSFFFCKFEISCLPKDILIRGINVNCHFDRPYFPVCLHICSRRKNYQIFFLTMINKRGSLGLASEDSLSGPNGNSIPVPMNVIALQGEPLRQLICPLKFEVLANDMTVILRPVNKDLTCFFSPVGYCELFSYVCFQDCIPILKWLCSVVGRNTKDHLVPTKWFGERASSC